MNINLQLMTGVDIPIPELQIVIHQPSIEEIAMMGEENFFMAMQYLCLDKTQLIEDKTLLQNFTNFQVLMKVLEQSQDKQQKRIMIKNLLQLLFPMKQSVILPSGIILAETGVQPVTIDDSNFDTLQEYIRLILCTKDMFKGDIEYKPANEAAQKIVDKIMAGRRKIAQAKQSGKQESVLTRLISVLVIGTQTITIESAKKLTLFQLFDLMERYSAFVEWDTDLKVRLAGGKPDNKVESWMRELHK